MKRAGKEYLQKLDYSLVLIRSLDRTHAISAGIWNEQSLQTGDIKDRFRFSVLMLEQMVSPYAEGSKKYKDAMESASKEKDQFDASMKKLGAICCLLDEKGLGLSKFSIGRS